MLAPGAAYAVLQVHDEGQPRGRKGIRGADDRRRGDTGAAAAALVSQWRYGPGDTGVRAVARHA